MEFSSLNDQTVRTIISCPDGGEAWRLLQEHVASIWAERKKVMPKRGGRRTSRRRLPAANAAPPR
jgi:hypothetical protein